jgi:hypothetical protein
MVYVCTCEVLLCQKSLDMILDNISSFYNRGVIVGIRAMLKLSVR